MLRAFSFAAAGLVLAAVPSAADLTVTSKHTRDGETHMATSYLTSDKMRMASSTDHETIIDMAKAEYTVIDNNKKEYFVITKQDMLDAAEQMKAAQAQAAEQMKKMEEQMKNLPPAVREKMKNLGGAMAQTIDVQKGTGHKTIAGYACDEWIMTIAGMSKTVQCLSMDVPFPPQVWDSYREVAEAFKGMGGPTGQYMGSVQEKTKDMKGFPLASTTTAMGHTESSEVTEIKKGTVPASAFDLPSGYKKKDSPFKGLANRKK
jgi:hypothetical protein